MIIHHITINKKIKIMSSEKDKLVDELFEIIQKKKEEIKKIEKPDWKTNCSFVSPLLPTSQPRNLRVLTDISELTAMVSDLLVVKDYNSKAAEILDVDATINWNGSTIEDWISDIKTRVSIVNIAKKKKELDALEKRLDKLVSKEKREEMELAAIRKELGL